MISMSDVHHQTAYWIWQEHREDVSIFPALAWFEYQAVASRLDREGAKLTRELYLLDGKNIVLPMDQEFIQRCASENLVTRFSSLRGADLVYACAAALENATLVTFDQGLRKSVGLVFLP